MPILTAQDRIGTVLDGKYRLDRVLGEGGMGVVYEGMHLRLERRVAVKFLHAQFSQSEDVVQRFVREAQATARLQHPNVVNVFDVDVSPDGCVFMVLEFLEGESLAQYLEKKPILDRSELLSIIGPVCEALTAAHAVGIVHRDIKPDNIHLSIANGRMTPKVLDFGIAKLTDAAASAKSATQTGSVMGTPLYMSPEQAMGRTKDIGPWSDLWSTAVMTYECLCGQPPFEIPPEASPTLVILAIMTGNIIPLSRVRPELVAVSDVLSRAIDRNHLARHESAASFYDALKRACEGPQIDVMRTKPGHVDPTSQMLATLYASPASPTNPGPPPAVSTSSITTPPTPRRGWMIGIGVVAVLLMMTIAGLAMVNGGAATLTTTGVSTPAPSTVAIAAPVPTTAVAPPIEVAAPSATVVPASAVALDTTATTPREARRPRDRAGSEPVATATTATTATAGAAGTGPRTASVTTSAGSGARSDPPPAPATTTADTHTHRAGGVSLDDF